MTTDDVVAFVGFLVWMRQGHSRRDRRQQVKYGCRRNEKTHTNWKNMLKGIYKNGKYAQNLVKIAAKAVAS